VTDLEAFLRDERESIDRAISTRLPEGTGPAATVARAMRYAVTAGGKRLRPILVLSACRACGGRPDDAMPAACAVELVHTYSLIHDDLPAMDDDDLRRGRPTVHRAFGEAAAILAGDALLTLAFEIVSREPEGDAWAMRRAEIAAVLARGAGLVGMVGGQIADLEAERTPPDAERLRWIHRHKTGALLASAAEIGAIAAGAGSDDRAALRDYGESIGLAFQIADDLLDSSATREELGKTPGKDLRSGKATYPKILGSDASRREAETLVASAIETAARFGAEGEHLGAIARFSIARSH